MNAAAFFDLVSLAGSLTAVLFLWLGRRRIPSRAAWVLFFIILCLGVLRGGSGFLESRGMTPVPGSLGDRLEVLNAVLWGFFFYSFLNAPARQALPESVEKSSRLYEGQNDILFVCGEGKDGEPDSILEVSDFACERLGYTREELLGMTPGDLVGPDPGWARKLFLKTPAGRGPAVFEGTCLTKEGERIQVEINARLFRLSGHRAILFAAREITKRFQWEKKAAMLRRLDQKILDNSPVAFVVADRKGIVVRASRAFGDLTGWDSEGVVGKNLEKLMPAGPFLEALKERAGRVLGEGVRVGPTEVMIPTSEPTWFRETLLPLFGPDGATVNVLAMLENITAEVKAKKKLKEITELDEKILSTSPVAFVLHDTQMRIVRVSRAYQEVSGFIPDQVLGKKLDQFMPEGPQREKILANLRQAMEYGVQVGPSEIESPIPGRFLRETIIPIFSPEGKVVNILSVLEDITRQLEERNERIKSEWKYRMLFENIQDGVALQGVRDDGRPGAFIQANPAFHDLIGYGEKELSKLSPVDISDEKSRVDQPEIEAALKMGRIAAFERVLFNKSGREVLCELRTNLVDLGGERVFLSICHDVTQRVLAEKRIRTSLREKEVLLREIHHRVKNNLQVISGLLNLQSYFLDDEAVRAIYKESQNRIQTMAMIHEELYQREDLSFINLNQYLGDLAQSLLASYLVQKDRVRLVLDLEKVDVVLDTAVPCGLILNELLTNSLKHAFPKDRRGEINVALKKTGADRFSLTIRDDGVGLPAGFDPQLAKTMGIQLVRILSEQLGGRLRHFPGEGASFLVEFSEYREAQTTAESGPFPSD